jgi:hypothetical protein
MLGFMKNIKIEVCHHINNESALYGEKKRIKQAVYSMLKTSCHRMGSGKVLFQCVILNGKHILNIKQEFIKCISTPLDED